ncbi:unnamed protein product, partial [Meganyctiphanes norvegica]
RRQCSSCHRTPDDTFNAAAAASDQSPSHPAPRPDMVDENVEKKEETKAPDEQELDEEQMAMLRKCFTMFDSSKKGCIEKEKIRTILNILGAQYVPEELETLLQENDKEESGMLNFQCFVRVVGHFMEEQDEEAMQKELKEAFRLYDKEGNGFIPIACLKEILQNLDDKLTSDDLDKIITEIDSDGSGTVDFDEFMEMMTGD